MIFRILPIAAAALLLHFLSLATHAEERTEISAVKPTEVVFGTMSKDDVIKAHSFSIVVSRHTPPKWLLSDKGIERLAEALRR